MNYGIILNIDARADAYKIHVAAQNRAEPDALIRADFHVADNRCIFSDKNAVVDFRLEILKRFNHF